jgi:hypothetical protein
MPCRGSWLLHQHCNHHLLTVMYNIQQLQEASKVHQGAVW